MELQPTDRILEARHGVLASSPDGSLLTAYYQKPAVVSDKCAFLWSRWELP